MPYTNFTNGITSFGLPVMGTTLNDQILTGPALFVDTVNGVNAGSGNAPNAPYATIAYALSQATAGQTIFVMAGSSATVSSATALTITTAGVQLIGLGIGTNRPTITFDTATTATIPVSVANVLIKNFIITANFADIVAPFTLTTAANFTLDSCAIKATATNMNFLWVVDTSTTDNAADGLTIQNCTWIEPDTATNSMVKADATIDRCVIVGNYLNLGVKNNTAAVMAVATGKIATNLRMGYNTVFRLNTDTATGAILFTTDGSTNTGLIYGNFVQTADTAGELLLTASAGLGTFQNFASGVQGASGYLLPAADS